MSEKNIKLREVERAISKNVEETKTWNLNAIYCEVNIKSYEKQILKLEKLHKDRINKLKLQIDRDIKNAKISHNNLDELLKEKEDLHIKYKAAIHMGEVQCEFCHKYYTPQGLSRHKASCSMKPEVKTIKKHEEEIKDNKAALMAKKAALKKELANLEKVAKE